MSTHNKAYVEVSYGGIRATRFKICVWGGPYLSAAKELL